MFFFFFFDLSPSFALPLWPCSAARAICAKANREQRDGRRVVAVGVGEKKKWRKGRGEDQWRLKEGPFDVGEFRG